MCHSFFFFYYYERGSMERRQEQDEVMEPRFCANDGNSLADGVWRDLDDRPICWICDEKRQDAARDEY